MLLKERLWIRRVLEVLNHIDNKPYRAPPPDDKGFM